MKSTLINKVLSRYLKELNVYSFYHINCDKNIINNILHRHIAYNTPIITDIYQYLDFKDATSLLNCASIFCSDYYNKLFNLILFNVTYKHIISYMKIIGAYNAFENEIKRNFHMSIDDYVNYCKYNMVTPFRFIRYAFNYPNTKDGHVYWIDIESKIKYVLLAILCD